VTFLEVKQLLRHPAAGLLRKKQSAFILAFLEAAFKATGLVQVPAEDLRARLEDWLDRHREAEEFETDRSAADFLEEWCSPACGWLRRTLPPVGEIPVFELTSATEKAFAWLETLQGAGFVGTESRLESLYQQIETLLHDASDDVPGRLKLLHEKRAAIDAEIAEIERTGTVETLQPWQVKERFQRLVEEARAMLSEFRQVEENFRELARMVVERQADESSNKGKLVGGVLDSHDALRESPQGRSFYGFVRLLLDPERRERFAEHASRVRELPELDDAARENELLHRLLPTLRREQDKVGETTQRLSANLRRALETSSLAERRRVRELAAEVRRLALRAKDHGPIRGTFYEVETPPPIGAAMLRPLWEPSPELRGEALSAGGVTAITPEMLRSMKGLAHLSLETLREQIDACLADRTWVSLAKVLERFPPRQGLLEVLGYLIVAAEESDRHSLPWDRTEVVALPDGSRWRVPQVNFGTPLAAAHD
jgi:hypothetical protein